MKTVLFTIIYGLNIRYTVPINLLSLENGLKNLHCMNVYFMLQHFS